MKHLIKIDDRSKTGKNLVELIKELSKSSSGIDFLKTTNDDDFDTVPFETFATELKAAVRSKLKK